MMEKLRRVSRFSLLFFFSTYLLVGTEAKLDAEGIVGGSVAPEDKFHYQIALIQDDIVSCGGAIIDKQHVLTAAHCVTNTIGKFVDIPKRIVAGSSDLNNTDSNAISIDVEKVYLSKEYAGGPSVADIAVLKLEKPVHLDSITLSKVELPEADNSYVGENATITGFGYDKMDIIKINDVIEEIGSHTSFKLKFAVARVVDNTQCEKLWQKRVRNAKINKSQICAQVYQHKRHEGVCAGDSGGPLVYENDNEQSVIIGILSSSPRGCTEKTLPAVYTRVSAFLEFIQNAIDDKVTSEMHAYEYTKSNKV